MASIIGWLMALGFCQPLGWEVRQKWIFRPQNFQIPKGGWKTPIVFSTLKAITITLKASFLMFFSICQMWNWDRNLLESQNRWVVFFASFWVSFRAQKKTPDMALLVMPSWPENSTKRHKKTMNPHNPRSFRAFLFLHEVLKCEKFNCPEDSLKVSANKYWTHSESLAMIPDFQPNRAPCWNDEVSSMLPLPVHVKKPQLLEVRGYDFFCAVFW